MAKRVYFAFHYQDVVDFRANVVRNHWVTKPDREAAGYFDASIWEEAQKQGDLALKRLINGALERTTVTCVLVGSKTFERPWVRYELAKSFVRGNKILAVHVNSCKGRDSKTKALGPNPLEFLAVSYSADGRSFTLFENNGGQWAEYSKIDGSAKLFATVAPSFWGKSLKLSQLFSIYDWDADDGYSNFASWVV